VEKRDRLIILGLFLLALCVYAPTFRAGYIWDDPDYVVNNQNLRSIGGVVDIWLSPKSLPQYYPLVHTTYWLEYRLWGLHPLGYHVVNVLLHALAGALFWRLLLKLQIPGALLASVLFITHPVMVESVAWVTERKNTLSIVFYLITLQAYLSWDTKRYTPGQRPDSTRINYILILALFLCALLSKSVTCSLPAAVLVILWWKHGRLGKADILPTIPLFILGLGMAIVTAVLERHHVGAAGTEFQFTMPDRVLIAGRAVWFYLWKLFYPMDLAFIYPKWDIDPRDALQWVFPLAVLLILARAWMLRRKIGRGTLAALLLFVGTLIPALGFINIYPMRYSFVADHFQYHASLAIFALAAATFARFRFWPWLLVIPLGVLTFIQAGIYRNVLTLWQDTVQKNPKSWMVHTNLAQAYDQFNDPRKAATHHQIAYDLAPDIHDTITNLAIVRSLDGDDDAALDLFDEAIRIQPNYADAHYSRGNLFRRRGELDRSIADYRRATELAPQFADAFANWGGALLDLNRNADAIEMLRHALELKPGMVSARANLLIAERRLRAESGGGKP